MSKNKKEWVRPI